MNWINEAKGHFPVHLYDYHGNLLESVLVKQTNLVSIGEGISEADVLRFAAAFEKVQLEEKAAAEAAGSS